ncbi:MAG: hypothetical protein M3441_26145 [Chloroflexota bacterium]|nr:hypothetical protein [Chloroflexota bacterium]
MDDTSVNRDVLAGDGFAYAASRRDAHEDVEAHYAALERLETPHGCIDGWMYLGFAGEDADGNPCEELERMPCRRCHGEDL